MPTTKKSKKGNTGKFMLGATIGAVVGAIAGKFFSDNQDKIDQKLGEFKDNMVGVKNDAKDRAEDLGDKIVSTGKTVKAKATKSAQKVARDTKKATHEVKQAAKKGIDKVEKTIKNA